MDVLRAGARRYRPATSVIKKQCPECGAAITADERFAVWCRACEWNVDPEPPRRMRFTGRLLARGSDRLAYQLYANVLAHRHAQRRQLTVAACSWLLAVTVHLITLGLLACAAIWIAASAGILAPVRVLVAVFLVGVFAYVQPFRRGRRAKHLVLRRAAAPQLFALVDDVAAAVRAPAVDLIAIRPDYHASYLKLGSRKPAIAIGLALWAALDPAERVALLGHELAHQVNGDLRSRVVISRAVTTLGYWQLLLFPSKSIWRSRSEPLPLAAALTSIVEQVLAPLILVPLFVLVQAVGVVLLRLAQRQGQRCEYYADELAATAAGTGAMVGLAEKLLIDTGCWRVVVQTLRFQQDGDPWDAVAQYVRAIPDSERERLRLLGRRRLQRIDAAHPPSQFRADVLRDQPPRPGLVRLPARRAAAIEAELAGARAELTRDLRASLGNGPR